MKYRRRVHEHEKNVLSVGGGGGCKSKPPPYQAGRRPSLGMRWSTDEPRRPCASADSKLHFCSLPAKYSRIPSATIRRLLSPLVHHTPEVGNPGFLKAERFEPPFVMFTYNMNSNINRKGKAWYAPGYLRHCTTWRSQLLTGNSQTKRRRTYFTHKDFIAINTMNIIPRWLYRRFGRKQKSEDACTHIYTYSRAHPLWVLWLAHTSARNFSNSGECELSSCTANPVAGP